MSNKFEGQGLEETTGIEQDVLTDRWLAQKESGFQKHTNGGGATLRAEPSFNDGGQNPDNGKSKHVALKTARARDEQVDLTLLDSAEDHANQGLEKDSVELSDYYALNAGMISTEGVLDISVSPEEAEEILAMPGVSIVDALVDPEGFEDYDVSVLKQEGIDIGGSEVAIPKKVTRQINTFEPSAQVKAVIGTDFDM